MLQSTSVVIVNWNLAQDTIECVNSLFDAGIQPGRIVVVDNGSTDDSITRLQDTFGDAVDLICSEQNLGFARGNNLAITHLLEQDAEWILLANNDTYVAATFFDELTDACQQNPNYKILAPLILYADSPKRIWGLGDRLIPGTMLTRSLWRNQPIPDDLPPVVETDFLTGCGLLIHRSVWEKVGLFDPDYFMYGEDSDLFWRARQAGFKMACATRAHMWHKVSSSTGVDHPNSRYWRIYYQILFYKRQGQGYQRPLMFLFTLMRSTWIALKDLLGRRPQLVKITAQAWFWGWFDKELIYKG